MDLKVLNDENKETTIVVVDSETLNASAILNVDMDLNKDFKTKIDIINKALEIVETEKLLTTFKSKVEKMAKRNTLILDEYKEIKDTIFKMFPAKDFEKVNETINQELMKLEIMGKTKKVYNCYDFWYTNSEKKLEKMIASYEQLKTYQKLYNEMD